MALTQAMAINGQPRVLPRRTTKKIFQPGVVLMILAQIPYVLPAVVLFGITCCVKAFLSEILENLI